MLMWHAGNAGEDPRALGTYEFLKELGKVGGFKADVTAFHQRWIAGRGCPSIAAAFVFNRRALLCVLYHASSCIRIWRLHKRWIAGRGAATCGSGRLLSSTGMHNLTLLPTTDVQRQRLASFVDSALSHARHLMGCRESQVALRMLHSAAVQGLSASQAASISVSLPPQLNVLLAACVQGCARAACTGRKQSVLELALRQSGPQAARAAAEKAASVATKEGSSVGMLKARLCRHLLTQCARGCSCRSAAPALSLPL